MNGLGPQQRLARASLQASFSGIYDMVCSDKRKRKILFLDEMEKKLQLIRVGAARSIHFARTDESRAIASFLGRRCAAIA